MPAPARSSSTSASRCSLAGGRPPTLPCAFPAPAGRPTAARAPAAACLAPRCGALQAGGSCGVRRARAQITFHCSSPPVCFPACAVRARTQRMKTGHTADPIALTTGGSWGCGPARRTCAGGEVAQDVVQQRVGGTSRRCICLDAGRGPHWRQIKRRPSARPGSAFHIASTRQTYRRQVVAAHVTRLSMTAHAWQVNGSQTAVKTRLCGLHVHGLDLGRL